MIRERVAAEAREYLETASLMFDLSETERDRTGRKALRLLLQALDEKLELNLERIFRLLGLNYGAKEMYDTYLGIRSKKPDLRANAVEFLDNVLDNELKRIIIPIVESGPDAARFRRVRAVLPGPPETEQNSLELLFESPDPWIRACTIYYIATTHCTEFKDKMAAVQRDENPWIRETARFCFASLS
jgi:AAA family ATP:ADP antiporter